MEDFVRMANALFLCLTRQIEIKRILKAFTQFQHQSQVSRARGELQIITVFMAETRMH